MNRCRIEVRARLAMFWISIVLISYIAVGEVQAQAPADPAESSRFLNTGTIGRSAEGNSIPFFRVGAGARKVLIWADLIGVTDGSSAVTDLLRYLASSDEPDAELIRQELSVTAILGVNRDAAGVPRYGHNAQGVALLLDREGTAPETRALMATIDSIAPQIIIGVDGWTDPSENREITFGVPPGSSVIGQNAEQRARAIGGGAAAELGGADPPLYRLPPDASERSLVHRLQERGIATVLIDPGHSEDPVVSREATYRALLVTLLAAAEPELPPTEVNLPVAPSVAAVFSPPASADLLIRAGRIQISGKEPLYGDIAVRFDRQDGQSRARLVAIGDVDGIVSPDTLDALDDVVNVDDASFDENGFLAPDQDLKLDIRSSGAPWSRRHWSLAGGRLEPWGDYASHRSVAYLSVQPGPGNWSHGGAVRELSQQMDAAGWGDDVDRGYPDASKPTTGWLIAVGYRTASQYRVEMSYSSEVRGQVTGANLDLFDAVSVVQRSSGIGLSVGRRYFDRVDLGIGGRLRRGSYRWQFSSGLDRDDDFSALGAALESNLLLLRLNAIAELELRARWEAFQRVEVPPHQNRETGHLDFSNLVVGLSLAILR